ncbi:MAG: copper amine oxidase N-terminal domain-containing protein [Peptococcaceae bacterium]|nr:copper amine oxidase N-terminal domain-containing protein [Peptococcaceae bacterium]
MYSNRSVIFRILLSSLAAVLLLVGIVSGARTGLAASVVTVGNEQLSFSGQTATGSIVTSGGGYDLINPGFNFSSGQETSGWSGNPDLSFGTDSNNEPALSGNVTVLPQSGALSAAPTQATVTVAVGDQLLVLTGGGSYYLVDVTAASPESVAFTYQAGTVQPVATQQPTQQPTQQTSISVSVGGRTVNFAGALATGTASVTGGGFSFQSGQETPGANGDISVSTDSGGQLVLSGIFAVMNQAGDGSYTSDVPGRQTGAISSADDSADLIFQSGNGDYVFVELANVSPDSVQFSYIVGPAPASQPSAQGPSVLTDMTDEQLLGAVTFGDKGDAGQLNSAGAPYTVSTKLGDLHVVTQFAAAVQTGIDMRKGNASLTSDEWNQLLGWAGYIAIMPQNSSASFKVTVLQNGAAISPYYVSNNGIYYYKISALDATVPLTIEDQSGSGSDTVTWNWNSVNEPAVEAQVASSIPSSNWVTEPGGAAQSQNPPASTTSSTGPQLLTLTDQPVVLHGRTFVPMRDLFEALGATVKWDPQYDIVTATNGSTTIKLQIGNLNAYINGNQQQLDDPPFIKDGRTFVPLRFAAEALGENVSYDDTTTRVTFGNYYFYINPDTGQGGSGAGGGSSSDNTGGSGNNSSNSTGAQGSGAAEAGNSWAREKAWEAEMNYYSGDMSGYSGSGSGDWEY